MPSTGAKVANLLGEARYSPGQLDDPGTNVRFGAFYLSRLLERCNQNVAEAARQSGIARGYLFRLIKKYSLR